MSDWEKTEKRKYDNAYGKWGWGDMCHFPKQGYDRWVRIFDITAYTFKKWLDVGCGPAYGLAYGMRKGLDVYGTDISSALMDKFWKPQGLGKRCFSTPAHRQPFNDGEFDFIGCFETLEHIPEEAVVDSLKEMRRVGSAVFCYSIALTEDMGPLGTKWKKSHVTVKPKQWWFDRLKETGHQVIDNMVTNENSTEGVHSSLFVLGHFGNEKKASLLVGKFWNE